jgi:transposase
MASKRTKYEEAFKIDLVEQVLTGGKTAAEVSIESGVEISSLYGWIRKYRKTTSTKQIFPGHGKLTSQEEELRSLRRRVAQLEEERTILKKATIFLARETK